MTTTKSPARPAPASLRWTSYFLTLLLTLLLVWLLGFLVADIGKIRGPDYNAIAQRHIDPSLTNRQATLKTQIEALDTQIRRQHEIQQTLRQSMENARQVMEQMMSLQRLSLEQNLSPSDTERQALADSQTRFLAAQQRFEEANEQIASSEDQRHTLNLELQTVADQVESQHVPARIEYYEQRQRHQFKIAALKLAVVVPLLLGAAWVFYRKRGSAFRPVYLAALIATFWRVGVVMFDHFPRDFFKYIAIGTTIVLVLAFLVRVLRRVVAPGAAALLKRYREAYNSHHCPICTYPIARGPFRHAIWTRKGPIALGNTTVPTDLVSETPYACPACGTTLFETCESCSKPRHSLLPFCESCGHEKPNAVASEGAAPDRSDRSD